MTHNSQTDENNINENIRAKRVLLIDESGNRMGEFLTKDAISIAEERGMDLVEVSNVGGTVVCRIADYGKMKYEAKKKESISRKNQVQQQMKEIKLRPLTSEHDLKIKVTNIRKFLSQGNKVKVSVQFQGRELSHRHIGHEQCLKIHQMVEDISEIEQQPLFEGRAMYMVLSPSSTTKS